MSGETEDNVSGWTVDTLREYLQRQIGDLRALLNERYETQTKAIDAAKLAQETAMSTAFTAADKAVVTAQLAQEKAINKAETAADKRFELLNELRTGVATKEQIDALEKQFNGLASRLDRTEGSTIQARTSLVDKRQGISQNVAVISVVLLLMSIIVPAVLALVSKQG